MLVNTLENIMLHCLCWIACGIFRSFS